MSHLLFREIGQYIGPSRFSQNIPFTFPRNRSMCYPFKISAKCPKVSQESRSMCCPVYVFMRQINTLPASRGFVQCPILVSQVKRQINMLSPSKFSQNIPFSFSRNRSIYCPVQFLKEQVNTLSHRGFHKLGHFCLLKNRTMEICPLVFLRTVPFSFSRDVTICCPIWTLENPANVLSNVVSQETGQYTVPFSFLGNRSM